MKRDIPERVHPWWGERVGAWWETAKQWFKEDTGGVVDEKDPEYDAQKIYTHYLTVLGILKKHRK